MSLTFVFYSVSDAPVSVQATPIALDDRQVYRMRSDGGVMKSFLNVVFTLAKINAVGKSQDDCYRSPCLLDEPIRNVSKISNGTR